MEFSSNTIRQFLLMLVTMFSISCQSPKQHPAQPKTLTIKGIIKEHFRKIDGLPEGGIDSSEHHILSIFATSSIRTFTDHYWVVDCKIKYSNGSTSISKCKLQELHPRAPDFSFVDIYWEVDVTASDPITNISFGTNMWYIEFPFNPPLIYTPGKIQEITQ